MDRIKTWNMYNEAFKALQDEKKLELPLVPNGCVHNAHMFYVKLQNLEERTNFIAHMKECNIMCVFHYVPLHSAPAGLKFGRFAGEDVYTTKESERLVRLPMYYGMKTEDVMHVIASVYRFFDK